MQGRPGGPASGTGREAHGRAAGTRPLSSLQLENKQKAGRLLVGTTGRFPWEKLPCSSPRWRCASLHRARTALELRAIALQPSLGARRSPAVPAATRTRKRPQLPTHASMPLRCTRYLGVEVVAVGARSQNSALQVILVKTFFMVKRQKKTVTEVARYCERNQCHWSVHSKRLR